MIDVQHTQCMHESSEAESDVSLAFYMCVDNSIGADGAKALAATLHTLTSLQTLDFGSTVHGVCWVDGWIDSYHKNK